MNADFTANQDNHIVTSPAKTVELSEPSDSHLERGESMGEEKEDVKIHLKGIGQISYLATKEESKKSPIYRFGQYCEEVHLIFDGTSHLNPLYRQVVTFITFGAIFISIISSFLATEPSLRSQPSTCSDPVCDNDPTLCPGYEVCEPEPREVFLTLDTVCNSYLVLEYVVRLSTVWAVRSSNGMVFRPTLTRIPSPDNHDDLYEYSPGYKILKFMLIFSNVIDILGSVLYFVNTYALGRPYVVNIIRIVRGIRLVGIISRKPETFRIVVIVVGTLKRSTGALGVIFLICIFCFVLFGGAIYVAESGKFQVTAEFPDGAYFIPNTDGYGKQPSPFRSIPTCVYWVATTMTTIGFGDLTPTTHAGRAIAVVVMYTGVILLALPVGVISSEFAELYGAIWVDSDARKREMEALRELFDQLEYQEKYVEANDFVDDDELPDRNVADEDNTGKLGITDINNEHRSSLPDSEDEVQVLNEMRESMDLLASRRKSIGSDVSNALRESISQTRQSISSQAHPRRGSRTSFHGLKNAFSFMVDDTYMNGEAPSRQCVSGIQSEAVNSDFFMGQILTGSLDTKPKSNVWTSRTQHHVPLPSQHAQEKSTDSEDDLEVLMEQLQTIQAQINKILLKNKQTMPTTDQKKPHGLAKMHTFHEGR